MAKISNPKTIRSSLNLTEKSAQQFFAVIKKHKDPPIDSAGIVEAAAKQYFFEFDLISLVRQQTLQLNHPYVRYYLLRWPSQEDSLREIHQGLEKRVKRQISTSDVIVLVAVWHGQANGWSLFRIQRSLEHRSVIGFDSREAFRRRVGKLLSLKGREGPFYNSMALPNPKDIPLYIQEAWKKAEANLRGLLDVPEYRQALEDCIRARGALRKALFPNIRKPLTKSGDSLEVAQYSFVRNPDEPL
jgi:hypothetical protein